MSSILPNLPALLAPALMERLVLVINHVLSREPLATARLVPHSGRTVRLDLQDLPRLVSMPVPLALRITPAGLVEWCAEPAPADLQVRLSAGNPAALALQALGGRMPALDIEGDAQLAADIDWLLKNLRWDVADDLHQLFGPVVAGQLGALGTTLAQALRAALQGAAGLAAVVRPR